MNLDTLLLRQIHPSFVQNGRTTSQAFTPTPKDSGMLSAYDGDQIAPEASWRHYTATLSLPSAGVMAITARECAAQGAPALPDPKPFPEHAIIDFRGETGARAKAIGKKLARNANQRGWLYRPGS